ncbi:PorV/PorQ family protein [Portibacter marinus]|uniref:PorV/PorQ family protein n=1 Tax=Portibacter marinus TaxID=2898660 RepID=UPI001F290228|nr:PorV/PorQ family protein [Portibacter marinus]
MMKKLYIILILVLGCELAFAGNPDRQGEAGASELLLNPWARSAGLHGLSTSFISGVESMRFNVAGLGRIKGTEFLFGNTRLYEGSGLGMNAFGFATNVGKSGAMGLSITSMDFGDVPITTVDQPEGIGGNINAAFFHIGAGYSYTYANKISVGALVRVISESLTDVSALGAAIDAGVQYVTGEKENFKLGVSLRNVGTPMRFSGEGLSFQTSNPEGPGRYLITVGQRAQRFELPSVLNIGSSYDIYISEESFVRAAANFTSNAFSRDNIGVGAEVHFSDFLVLRGAYKYDIGSIPGDATNNIYTGLAAGISLNIPIKRDSHQKVGIDYAYRTTSPFRGTHNIGVKLNI